MSPRSEWVNHIKIKMILSCSGVPWEDADLRTMIVIIMILSLARSWKRKQKLMLKLLLAAEPIDMIIDCDQHWGVLHLCSHRAVPACDQGCVSTPVSGLETTCETVSVVTTVQTILLSRHCWISFINTKVMMNRTNCFSIKNIHNSRTQNIKICPHILINLKHKLSRTDVLWVYQTLLVIVWYWSVCVVYEFVITAIIMIIEDCSQT